MTRKRFDEHSTEFGLWLREQREISSVPIRNGLLIKTGLESEGYAGHNLDFIWYCYTKRKVMLIEEKRYGGDIAYSQRITHGIIDTALRFACENGCLFETSGDRYNEIEYHGYHVIRFGKTNPEDGWIELDGKKITKDRLLEFLKFEWIPENES